MQWVPLHYRDMERLHGDESDLVFLENAYDTKAFLYCLHLLFSGHGWLKGKRQLEDQLESKSSRTKSS